MTAGLVDPKTLYVTSEDHHRRTASTNSSIQIPKIDHTIGRRAISKSTQKQPSVMERLRTKEPLRKPLLNHRTVENTLNFDQKVTIQKMID